MSDRLKKVVIVYESQASAEARLARYGYSPQLAAEIAVYLAQSADLPDYFSEIREELAAVGASVEFIEIEEVLPPGVAPQADQALFWCQTDGIRFYRGSSLPFLARLSGAAWYGSSLLAQALCQNKFECLTLAEAAGLTAPPSLLLEDREVVASLGRSAALDGSLFVKPNTLGAKIGIFAHSRASTMAEALDAASRIWDRYRDRAVVQPFIEGDDVRVSYMDLGGAFAAQIGLAQLVKNPDSETGGAFMTMRDNDTLSGAKDLSGARGGFGLSRALAPRRRGDHPAGRAPRAPRRACRLLLDGFSHRCERRADLFRIRSLPRGDDLRLPDLPSLRSWLELGRRIGPLNATGLFETPKRSRGMSSGRRPRPILHCSKIPKFRGYSILRRLQSARQSRADAYPYLELRSSRKSLCCLSRQSEPHFKKKIGVIGRITPWHESFRPASSIRSSQTRSIIWRLAASVNANLFASPPSLGPRPPRLTLWSAFRRLPLPKAPCPSRRTIPRRKRAAF